MSPFGQLRTYPPGFGWHTVKFMPKFKTRGEGAPQLGEDQVCDGPQAFQEMTWDTELDWQDARLTSVILYLRGNVHLKLPQSWRAVFPTHL